MSASDRLRELVKRATPGRWRQVGGTVAGHRVDAVYGGAKGEQQVTRWPSEDDARLIALAPELAELLADCLDALDAIESKLDHEGLGVVGPDGVYPYLHLRDRAEELTRETKREGE